MALSEAGAGLAGAVIGAGGAVIAQWVASRAAARSAADRFRDEQAHALERFGAEQAEARRRESAARDQRFIEVTRLLCAQFLGAYATFEDQHLSRFLVGLATSDSRFELMKAWTDNAIAVDRIAQELMLVAPDLEGPCRDLDLAAVEAFGLLYDEGREHDTTAYTAAMKECRTAMSGYLNRVGAVQTP